MANLFDSEEQPSGCQSVVADSDVSAEISNRSAILGTPFALESLLSHLDHAIWTSSANEQSLVFHNDAVERIFGYPRQMFCADPELKNRAIMPVDRSRVKKVKANLLSPFEELHLEYRIVRANKDICTVHEHIIALPPRETPSSSYTLLGIIKESLHLSDYRHLEEKLFHKQKLESLGTLAGGIAHDFNNLLAIILGHASLLGEPGQDFDTTSRRAGIIRNAAKRGAALVAQLLTFAKENNNINIRPIQINDIIADLCSFLRGTFSKNIIISDALAPNLPKIMADTNQLNQALVNLCNNAKAAMPNGGNLKISTSLVSSASIRAPRSNSLNRYFVKVEIADTGTGMHQSVVSKAFDPYFSTKGIGKGSGLGLAVAFGVVENHHGHIEVKSEAKTGTRFFIYLPVEDSLASSVESQSSPSTRSADVL